MAIEKHNLLQLLASLSPTDVKERDDLARMRAFAQSLDAPTTRTQWPAHFTASALVVSADQQRVALVLHGKLNRWLQPGGHIEPNDESVRHAALREVHEELGIESSQLEVLHDGAPFDVDIHVIPSKGDQPKHEHLDLRYLFKAKTDALTDLANESHALRWFTFAEALALAGIDPAFKRMLLKAQR